MIIKFIKEVTNWIKTFILVAVLSILISIFVFEPYLVSGSSMEPTLTGEDLYNKDRNGDRVIVLKYFGEEPSFGDIVVIDSRVERRRTIMDDFLENPIINTILQIEQDHLWIKRIIGEPGDVLEFSEGEVYRNGDKLREDYINEDMKTAFGKVEVPKNHIFVMGDNRNFSKDSRQVGVIPLENVKGRLVLRYFPIASLNTY